MRRKLLCFIMALAIMLCVAKPVEVYAASSTTTKTSTTAKTSSTTKATSSTTTGTKTQTTTSVIKNKVGTKTWKTQKIVKEFNRGGKKIYGEIYRPVGEGQFPGIIIAHGFNSNCGYARDFAQQLAKNGVVAYIFDFIGGGYNVKSGGNMTEMSMRTEAADFNVVFNGIRSLNYVDEKRMFVMGESMGGYVATYIAGTRPNDVKGLIAFCPAYSLSGEGCEILLKYNLVPSVIPFMGAVVGRKFIQDLVGLDIYKTMANFNGKAVIAHGTNDNIVPISYSEKAIKTMKNAKLVRISGAGHGLAENSQARAAALNLIKELSNK